MSDKEFEEWLINYTDGYPCPHDSVIMYNRKDMRLSWQAATVRATEAERKRIVEQLRAWGKESNRAFTFSIMALRALQGCHRNW